MLKERRLLPNDVVGRVTRVDVVGSSIRSAVVRDDRFGRWPLGTFQLVIPDQPKWVNGIEGSPADVLIEVDPSGAVFQRVSVEEPPPERVVDSVPDVVLAQLPI